jgi:hypothetical protein
LPPCRRRLPRHAERRCCCAMPFHFRCWLFCQITRPSRPRRRRDACYVTRRYCLPPLAPAEAVFHYADAVAVFTRHEIPPSPRDAVLRALPRSCRRCLMPFDMPPSAFPQPPGHCCLPRSADTPLHTPPASAPTATPPLRHDAITARARRVRRRRHDARAPCRCCKMPPFISPAADTAILYGAGCASDAPP